MKRTTGTFAAITLSLLAFAMPLSASAQAVVQTIQLLPPNTANTCSTVTTQGIVAHVREGGLHSFDVSLGNASYVAIAAQVGPDTIPFNYVSRFNYGGGFIRHHVDTQTTPIGTGLPVSLTLLSSPPGSPTCMTVVSFTVAPDGSIMAPGFTSSPAAPTTGSSSGSGMSSGTKPIVSKPTTTVPAATSSTSTVEEGGIAATLAGMCSASGATQLWFLLLAVYVVIAAMTALARPPLTEKFWVPLAVILVPLVLLLLFWYFAPVCRAGGWVPAVAIIIGIVALLVAFRDQKSVIKVISLPASTPKPSPNTPVVTKGTLTPAVSTPKKDTDQAKK